MIRKIVALDKSRKKSWMNVEGVLNAATINPAAVAHITGASMNSLNTTPIFSFLWPYFMAMWRSMLNKKRIFPILINAMVAVPISPNSVKKKGYATVAGASEGMIIMKISLMFFSGLRMLTMAAPTISRRKTAISPAIGRKIMSDLRSMLANARKIVAGSATLTYRLFRTLVSSFFNRLILFSK